MGCVPSGNVIVCSPFAIGKSTWVIEHNGPCSSMLPSGHHDNGRITTTSPMTDRSHGLSPGCYAPGCVAASRRASNDVRRMRKRTARRGRYGRWPMAVGFGQNLVCFPKDFVHPPIVVYVAKIWLVTLQESNVVLAGNSTIYFDDFSRTKPLFTGDHPASDVWLPEGMYQVLINYCRPTENWFDTWISRRVWDLTDMHHFWRSRGRQNFAIWGHVSVQTWPIAFHPIHTTASEFWPLMWEY